MNILIVDDEPISVNMLVRKIPWKLMPIDQVYTANDTAFARQILETFPVDILLCDIEMPGENGIDFLRRLRSEGRSELVTLLLTCHDDFRYAREAVSLDVMEYLLKPVAYDELTKVLQSAVAERQRLNATRQSVHDQQLWEKHRNSVLRSFWQDYLRDGMPYSMEQAEELGIHARTVCLPVLFRQIDTLGNLSRSDILLFLERQTRPIFEAMCLDMAIFMHTQDSMLLIAWGEALHDAQGAVQEILAQLKEILRALRLNQIHLCGCMNNFISSAQLPDELHRFEQFQIQNKQHMGMFLVDSAAGEDVLLDTASGAVFDQLCEYIRTHLCEEFTRQELAETVHLNPDYLARLFKRRTGLTVKEYVRRERLNLAKHLLRNTEHSISEIAIETGFTTQAYFANTFHHEFGISPSDYRGKYNKQYK